jgi:ABC-type transporter Mla subunit MlaD
MSDQTAMYPGQMEPAAADLELATRRLMAALEALESAVERRREADRDEDELATRIQALGADRSRLADELDGSLMKSRKLERANREIAERLDVAIGSIRSVLSDAATVLTETMHEEHEEHAHENEEAEDEEGAEEEDADDEEDEDAEDEDEDAEE